MNGVMNWTFKDVVAVLVANSFTDQTSHKHKATAHRQFVNADCTAMVTVSDHGSASIRPKTFENIMLSSGLPRSYWLKCTKMNKREIKKNPYVDAK
jgi:predicted RNA binding protein YcfA (HicA-like mRNA interferase family)